MATQCRSSKCTAERKGFRRELDSWRHKLIHCVGFESILEGIYGPRLLQDLNIFDECEPEAADDWSVDANCSFCNLQLEKLNDHPALVVAGSPPSSETPPPQGLSTSEKLQCQADRFLHAIFHKKEIPQRCDPSIPLVAQELMRKMVRRFAFEYACKSQAHEDMSDDSEPFPHQTDPDGPLDLTVSRASQALPQDVDGVLDLSKKNTSAQDRGFLGTIEEDQSRPKKDDGSKTPEILKATVLDKVLSSLCSRHRTLLYYILKDVREEHFKITVIVRDTHGQKLKTRSLSCHADRKLLSDPPSHALSDCTVSDDVCRMAACKCPSCTFSPFCVYLCSIHGHSFQNTALACADKVMCCNSTVCPTQSKLPLCQHPKICQSKGATVVPQEECKRSCSPPPFLSSLQPVDWKVSVLHSEDSKTQNQTSPTLLPHRTEVEDEFANLQTEEYAAIACPQTEKEIEPLVGLVNGVTENLESLSENEDILANQMFNATNDAHLSDKNCNHNELFEQPMGDPITKKGVKGDDPPMRAEREIQPQHPGFKDSSSFDEPEYLQVTGNGQLVKIKDDTQYGPTVGRSRRHIVPPQRFSSYVTEPRKMYFAACFSERIFTKISPKDDQMTTLGLNEETALQSSANDVNALRVTPQNIDVVDEISSQKCNGHVDAYGESVKDGNSSNIISHSQTCCTFNSPTTNSSNPPETDAAQCSELKYDSPIKLMFFSSVEGENGVKYKLKAAASCSNSHEEAFDPFVESSWQSSAEHVSLSAILNPAESNLSSPKKVTQSDPSLRNRSSEPQETAITHQKRGPGRPRKIGPHNVKLEKRPIGRPPKPKLTDLSVGTSKVNSNTENSKTQPHSENDRNKNIQVTILYGRSRGIKRVVSEGVGLGSALSHTGKDNMTSRNCSGKEFGCKTDLMTRQSFKDLSFVMPVEEKKCISSSSIIKCEKQNDQAVSKRPGRPAKVKISGISVTVSTASPKQRKICLKRDTKDERKEPSRTFLKFQPLKEQNATHLPTVVHKDIVDAPKECNRKSRGQLPVRHSVRERKPSIHLLHSVATARSCALIRRSRKLLLNKASCEASHLSQNRQVEPSNLAISPLANVRCVEDLDKVSAISLDPIFSPNECTKWWLTSASPNTLKKELARKIRVISNTWVSEMVEPKRSEVKTRLESKRCFEGPAKKPISAIKKLFGKNYDMEKLCTWFMQTTETQALGIVKKARARNSKDVFHYNPSRPNCRAKLCPSPQAERLRKHMKKFAKVIPKTPTMHKEEQEVLFQTNKLKSKRRLFTIPVKVKRNNGQPKSSWILYRATLLRAKRKFSKTEMAQRAGEVETDLFRKCSPATQDLSKEMQLIDEPHLMKVQNALNLVQSPQRMGFPKENQIGSKAWSPESLTECRVFLKKINSPGTKSSTEDCDLCTVKLYDDSETEVGMTGSSPVPLAAFSPSPRESRRKRGKWKSSTSSSPPAKMLRQSRSSRGVLGARWCDFVLGSLK